MNSLSDVPNILCRTILDRGQNILHDLRLQVLKLHEYRDYTSERSEWSDLPNSQSISNPFLEFSLGTHFRSLEVFRWSKVRCHRHRLLSLPWGCRERASRVCHTKCEILFAFHPSTSSTWDNTMRAACLACLDCLMRPCDAGNGLKRVPVYGRCRTDVHVVVAWPFDLRQRET